MAGRRGSASVEWDTQMRRFAVHIRKIGGLQGTTLGVRGQHLVPAFRVQPLHLAVADVRHNDIAVGVDANAVWHAPQIPHQRMLAVGCDAGAATALVGSPDNAVARNHGALRAGADRG